MRAAVLHALGQVPRCQQFSEPVPPPPGAVPRVSRTVAECEALAAIGSNGGALDIAADEYGLAIGYAMVTVSPGLPVDSSSWQPCDFHDSVVNVIPGTGLVRVLAYGAVAARCGRPRPATVYLQAASVTQNLPPVLVHAPAGLYIPGTGNTAPPESEPPTGTLITLGVLDSGTTITVHVGDVVAPPPTFPDEDPSTAEPTHSSDPAVLGPLGGAEQGSFAEFRAWQPGQATLTSPGGTWLVHVVVLARRLFPGDDEDIGATGYAGSPGAEQGRPRFTAGWCRNSTPERWRSRRAPWRRSLNRPPY